MDSGAEMGPLPGIVNPYFISVPLTSNVAVISQGMADSRQFIDGSQHCQRLPARTCSDKIDQIVPEWTGRYG